MIGLAAGGVGFVLSGPALAEHPRQLRMAPSGRIGPLRLDRSTGVAVIRLMGWPDALGSGNFAAIPRTPDYEALGYACVPGSTTATMSVPGSGESCQLVFYINAQTRKLAAAWSDSPDVVTPGEIHSGDPADRAANRLHKQARIGCLSGFLFGTAHTRAQLYVSVIGGSPAPQPSEALIGGTVGSFALESNRDPVGLLFC